MIVHLPWKCIVRLTLGAFFATSCALASDDSILGAWTGRDERGVEVRFVFLQDGTADILSDGESMGEAVISNGGSITYVYDASSSPKSLDVVLTTVGRWTFSVRGIVEFVDEDSLRLRFSKGNGPRPSDFGGSSEDTIVLRREDGQKPNQALQTTPVTRSEI